MIRLISWNVNGIRAVAEKGLFEWMRTCGADIICLQETKAHPDQLAKHFFEVEGFSHWWASAKKKGYSGTAIYSRIAPKSVEFLGEPAFDDEGRVLQADFGNFILFNCYFPNSQDAGARLGYKLAFLQALKSRCDALIAAGRQVVITGDFNIAHKPIDLEHPKANEGNPGYLPEERSWMDSFLKAGYIDTFRRLHPEPKQYSWWSYRLAARERNVGWRIDYFCTSPGLAENIRAAAIHQNVFGSDHCPVSLDLEF